MVVAGLNGLGTADTESTRGTTGAALAVLVTMLASLTLMPAVLSKIGGRVKPAKVAGNGTGDLADQEGGVGVAVHPFAVEGDITVDDVTVPQRTIVGDAVADDFVDRGAQ